MRTGLVLGGGGLVGMGYHAGALKALDEAGIDPAGFDVIVGTSAGAIVAAYLCAGRSPTDLYEYAHGRRADDVRGPETFEEEVNALFTPLWASPAEWARRAAGGLFAVAAARGYWRRFAGGRIPPAQLRKLFPAGMYSARATHERFQAELPADWPRSDLYVCAIDLYSGERVAFERSNGPAGCFPLAVLASAAIPGVFPPVRIGPRYYVDGGATELVSLDVAVRAGCERIVCVAPLAWQRGKSNPALRPQVWGPALARSLFVRGLGREIAAATAAGVEVTVLGPGLDDLAAHGISSMALHDRSAVVEGARRSTLRLLEAS